MDFYHLGDYKYLRPPLLEPVRSEFTMARKRMTKFFMEEVDLSPTIFFETDKMRGIGDCDPEDYQDYTVYQHDRARKAKVGLPQLTAARLACDMHNCQIFFGKPDPLLIMEEICARLPLSAMLDIFDESL